MYTIIDSDKCYIGRTKDSYELGCYGDLYDSEEVDNSSIEFDTDNWNCEQRFFLKVLKDSITKFEKRYKTIVQGIALVGKIGTWKGKFTGGKIIDIDNIDNFFSELGQYDELTINADTETDTMLLNIYHHDGTHILFIHLLTENKIRQLGVEIFNGYYYEGISALNDYEILEKIGDKFKALRYGR